MCCGKEDPKRDLNSSAKKKLSKIDRRDFLKVLGASGSALAVSGLLTDKVDFLSEAALGQGIFKEGDKLAYTGKYQAFDGSGKVVDEVLQAFDYNVKKIVRGEVTFSTTDIFDTPKDGPRVDHIIDTSSRKIIQMGDLKVADDNLGWGLLAPPGLKPGQQFPIMRQVFSVDPKASAVPVPFGRTSIQALPATLSIKSEAVQATITNFYDQARGFLVRQRAELRVLTAQVRDVLGEGVDRLLVEIDAISLPGIGALALGGPSSSVVVPAGLATPSMGIALANYLPPHHGRKKCVRLCMALSWSSLAAFFSALAICGALCIVGTPAACVACLAVYVGWVIAVQYPQCKEHCGCPCS